MVVNHSKEPILLIDDNVDPTCLFIEHHLDPPQDDPIIPNVDGEGVGSLDLNVEAATMTKQTPLGNNTLAWMQELPA